MNRRSLLAAAAASVAPAASGFLAPMARAQSWPGRPITLVAPYGAGGTSDTAARLYAEFMSDALGHRMIVENRPGAQGNIGADTVARAPPDGYSLLMGGNFLSQNPSTGPKPRFDADALQPVTLLAFSPAVVMVNRKTGATTLQEVLRRASEKPGTMTVGAGNIDAYVGLLLQRADAKLRLVNYRTSPQAITDVLAGHIDVAMSIVTTAVPLLRHPDLLPIAVSSEQRSPALPEVPTYAECGIKDAEIVSWFGTFAPARTPPDIVGRLATEGRRFLASADTGKRFSQVGLDLPRGFDSPEAFLSMVRADMERWRDLAAELQIKAE